MKPLFVSALITGLLTCPMLRATPVIANVYARKSLSLDGAWNTIVDPYESGYLDYRLQPFDEHEPPSGGFFLDRKQAGLLVHIRLWLSPEAREAAQQDPDVHRYWINLGEVAVITTIYEDLDEVFRNYESPLGAALEAHGKE